MTTSHQHHRHASPSHGGKAAGAGRGPRRIEYSAELAFSEPDDSGKVRFSGTATTNRRLKLERTRILDKAWTPEVIENFMRNPVATYQHNGDYVIGLYDHVEYADGMLSVEGWISAKAIAPTQEPFGDLVRDGRLRGLSVTIDVLDYEDTPDGQDFSQIELWDIALTPTPRYSEALMTQVNSRESEAQDNQTQEDNMKEITKALGLAEDADEAAIVTAIDELRTKAESPPIKQTNSKTDEPEMTERERELVAKVAELEAKELVAQHASKVSAPLKEWAHSYARKDPDGFRAWAAAAPSATPPEGRVVNHSKLETETEKRVGKTAERLGITDEDREKYRHENVTELMFGKAGR
jgi:hypothetical protein